jgi:DtxR family Mn-dependent transcriptional regulator
MINAMEAVLSNSMQMYLVKIKRLEGETSPVPLSLLASSFQISPVSVNEMCRKLDEMDLIKYLPYKGAQLTEKGNEQALQVLRKHRLWEVFLVDKLNFDFETAHEMADDLEHATSCELAARLEDFLGSPRFNPEGKEIPAAPGKLEKTISIPLLDVAVGSSAHFLDEDLEKNLQDFLRASGIRKGALITVVGKSDRNLLLRVKDKIITLSTEFAETIKALRVVSNSIHEGKSKTKERKVVEKVIVKTTLKDLGVGKKGVVVSVKGTGAAKQRMMDMGLVSGCEVEVIRVAPLGDPIQINLKGYNLSLRKNEAQYIEVEVVEEDE